MLARNQCMTTLESERPDDEKAAIIWKRDDNKAMDLIVQCVADCCLELVKPHKTAKAMINALKNTYVQKGMSSRIELEKRLRNMRYVLGTPMQNFLMEFDTIIQELGNLGSIKNDEEYVTQLLASLTDDFDPLIRAIDILFTSSDENKKLVTRDYLKQKLLAEEKHIARKRGVNSDPAADSNVFISRNFRGGYRRGSDNHYPRGKKNFRNYIESGVSASSGRPFGANPSSHSRENFQFRGNCGKCGGKGHMRKECPSRPVANTTQTNEEEEEIAVITFDNVPIIEPSEIRDSVAKQDLTPTNLSFAAADAVIEFVVDSGSTFHIIQSKFEKFLEEKSAADHRIGVAKRGEFIVAKTIGALPVLTDQNALLSIKHVHVCQDILCNLLSVKQMTENGLDVVFESDRVNIRKNGRVLMIGERRGNLYYVVMKLRFSAVANVTAASTLMHRRFGHSSRYPVSGVCEVCVRAKQARSPFSETPHDRKATFPLEIVSTDVLGKMTPAGHDGSQYYCSFVDHYTSFGMIFLMKEKSEVDACLRKYVSLVENKFGRCIVNLRLDNAGENSSANFRKFCEEKGINLIYTIPRNPENNGRAEIYNKIVMQMVRSLLFESGLPKNLWNEAALCAVFLINRLKTRSLNSDITPAEMWYGHQPDLRRVRVFGCTAYAHIPAEDRQGKLAPRSSRMRLVGYTNNHGYRLWDATRNRVITARSVIFDENPSGHNVEVVEGENCGTPTNSPKGTPTKPSPARTPPEPIEETPEIRRGNRERRPPVRLMDYMTSLALPTCLLTGNDAPNSYEEAIEEDEGWRIAVANELDSMQRNGTWELVRPPPGDTPIIDSRWVFTRKNVDGRSEMKARLVARGYQQPSLEDDIIFSPVCRMLTLRLLLGLAVDNGMQIEQLDCRSAFLRSKLNEPVYMKPPSGLENSNGLVCKLIKSLYGLRQSPKCFNDYVNDKLSFMGLTRSKIDPCLYFKTNLWILIWIDDFLVFSKSEDVLQNVKAALKTHFDLKEFKIKNNLVYLGLEIRIQPGKIIITQNNLINKVIDIFNLHDSKSHKIPISPNLNLVKNDTCDLNYPYRELIGSLMYIMLGSRPDICYSISYFGKFQNCYSATHFNHLKNVVRYLKSTRHLGLTFLKFNCVINSVTAFADSDFASDMEDRKSVSGFLIKLNDKIITWQSKKQVVVTLSTCEAEYVSLSDCIKECIFVKQILIEIASCNLPIVVFEDNQSCIKMAKTWETKRSKHIDVRFHFVKDLVDQGQFKIEYISTAEQPADLFTKGLTSIKFEKFRKMLNLDTICTS